MGAIYILLRSGTCREEGGGRYQVLEQDAAAQSTHDKFSVVGDSVAVRMVVVDNSTSSRETAGSVPTS